MIVAVVRHQRRHHEIRQPQRRRSAHPIEPVVADRGLDRGVLRAPFRQQAVEPDRIDHRARQDVGADLGSPSRPPPRRAPARSASGGSRRRGRPAPRRRSRRRIPLLRARGRHRPWRSRNFRCRRNSAQVLAIDNMIICGDDTGTQQGHARSARVLRRSRRRCRGRRAGERLAVAAGAGADGAACCRARRKPPERCRQSGIASNRRPDRGSSAEARRHCRPHPTPR